MTLTATDDSTLLAAFAGGDERALEALVDRHWTSTFRVARALSPDADAAEDAAQEALVALVTSVRRGAAPARVGPWLHGVAANRARMCARAARRRDAHEQAARATRPSGDGLDLRELIDFLPEKLRVPLELHFVAGLTHAEVARTLGCPVGTASSRIRLGLERVRERLSVGAGASLALVVGAAERTRGTEPAAPAVRALLGGPARFAPLAAAARSSWRAAVAGLVIASLGAAGALAAVTEGVTGHALQPDPAARSSSPSPTVVGSTASATTSATGPTGDWRGATSNDAPARAAGSPDALPAVVAGPALVTPTRWPLGALWHPSARFGILRTSPDGRFVLTTGRGDARVWDVARRTLVTTLTGPSWPERWEKSLVTFVDRSSCLVATDEGAVVVDAGTGDVIRRLRGVETRFGGRVAACPGDGRTVFLFDPDEAWDVVTDVRTPLGGRSGVMWAAAVDGATLLVLEQAGETHAVATYTLVGDGWCRGWTCPLEPLYPSFADVVRSLDGRTVHVVGADARSRAPVMVTVDATTGGLLARRRLTEGCVKGVTATGTLLASAPAGGVRLLSLGAAEPVDLDAPGLGEEAWPARSLADGRTVATVGEDDVLRLWDAQEGRPLGVPDVVTPASALAVSPDGAWLASSHATTGEVGLWDTARGALCSLVAVGGEPRAVGWGDDGVWVVSTDRASGAATLATIDPTTGALRDVRLLGDGSEVVTDVELSTAGELIALASAGETRVLTSPALSEVARFDGAAVVALGTRRLARALGSDVVVHDLQDGAVVASFSLPRRVVDLRFDATEEALLVGTWEQASAWEVATGRRRWAHDAADTPVAFSADGRLALVASSYERLDGEDEDTSEFGHVLVLDTATGVELGRLRVEQAYRRVAALAVDPRGGAVFGGTWEDTRLGTVVRWPLPR